MTLTRETLDRLSELIALVPDYASMAKDPDKHGYYDCPLCDGEGYIEGSVVLRSGSRDKHPVAEAYGVQCFGIGDDHLLLNELIPMALHHLPALIASARASVGAREVQGMEAGAVAKAVWQSATRRDTLGNLESIEFWGADELQAHIEKALHAALAKRAGEK